MPEESVTALPEPPCPQIRRISPKVRQPESPKAATYYRYTAPRGILRGLTHFFFWFLAMDDPPGPQPSPWPTTQWTLIDLMSAPLGQAPGPEEIGEFLMDYLAPLQAYLVRRRGLSIHDAEDVLQEFVLQRMLSLELTKHVDKARGRFRTFLLTALDHFLRNHYRKQGAKKRSPANALVPLQDDAAPAKGDPLAADDLFEVEWARMIVRQAIGLVKQHCDQTDRPDLWRVFEARVLSPILDHTKPASNDVLAQRLGMQSPQQVSNAVATTKRIYKRALHDVIVKYARNRDEVETELNDLRAILARQTP